ncbi:hypothetical protein Lal_00014709, partial [Lupinus albus]
MRSGKQLAIIVASNSWEIQLYTSIKFRYKASTSQNYKKCTKSVLVGSYAFNQDATRRALAKMIIVHEYPMSMVDHILLRSFVVHCNLYLNDCASVLFLDLDLPRVPCHNNCKLLSTFHLSDVAQNDSKLMIFVFVELLQHQLDLNSELRLQEKSTTTVSKFQDLGTFSIPCTIGSVNFGDAMVDLGTSMNIMHLSIFKSFVLGPLKLIGFVIKLANMSCAHPKDFVINISLWCVVSPRRRENVWETLVRSGEEQLEA